MKINDERLKLKVEKAAADIAAMKLASGAKGKGKKGKDGKDAPVIDVTVTEEVPVDLEPLLLPRCEVQLVLSTLSIVFTTSLHHSFHHRQSHLIHLLLLPATLASCPSCYFIPVCPSTFK